MRSFKLTRPSRPSRRTPLLKKITKRFSNYYNNSVQNIEEFLDKEIDYLDSFRQYKIKKDLKSIPMNYKTFNFDKDEIISFENLNEKSLKEIIKISKNTHDKTWGVILEASKIDDLNIYIAQMNKVQMNIRKSNFFVITDCREVLYKLSNIFNWMNRDFYIVPNVYNYNIEESNRMSINYHILSELDKIISTPDCKITSYLKNNFAKDVLIPNPEKVFSFKCKSLLV